MNPSGGSRPATGRAPHNPEVHMITRRIAVGVCLALCAQLALGGCVPGSYVAGPAGRVVVGEDVPNLGPAAPAELRVAEPWTFDNLAVYAIHGADHLAGAAPVPLQQALAAGDAVVWETGSVAQLIIENR